MIELKLKEMQSCLERISQLASMQEKEYAADLSAQRKQMDTLTEEKRRLNEQVNELIISSGRHEKENTRILLAGLFYGAIIGVVGTVVWMSYL